MLIKKGDTILVISGKDKGKSGKVLRVFPAAKRMVVEGVNIRRKMRRARKQGEKGQTVQIPMPIHSSNVMLFCPQCGKPTRRASIISEGREKMRLCKKCKAAFI